MWTTPSGDSLFNDHPFGTFDAWSGRRPPHHSRRFRGWPTISGIPRIGPASGKTTSRNPESSQAMRRSPFIQSSISVLLESPNVNRLDTRTFG
jgi:hypothetical protein